MGFGRKTIKLGHGAAGWDTESITVKIDVAVIKKIKFFKCEDGHF